MLHFHLKACPKCRGDLALDEGDWLCLQCGTYYYTRLYRKPVRLPITLPAAGTQIKARIETPIKHRGGERREKALSVFSRGVGALSRFPDMAMTASGLGGLPETGIQTGPGPGREPGAASNRRFDESAFVGNGEFGMGGLDRAGL